MSVLPTFIILGICTLAGQAHAQTPAAPPVSSATHRISYSAVVPLAGVSQADLVARAQAWAEGMIAADKPSATASEPDTELISATGSRPFPEAVYGKVVPVPLHYTAKIWLRAGRYKYELTDFVLVYPATGIYPVSRIPADDYFNGRIMPIGETGTVHNNAMRECFVEAAAELVAGLQQKMRKPVLAAEVK